MRVPNVVSVCCSAYVELPINPLSDFLGDSIGQGITMYYICMKCKKACDGKEDKKKYCNNCCLQYWCKVVCWFGSRPTTTIYNFVNENNINCDYYERKWWKFWI